MMLIINLSAKSRVPVLNVLPLVNVSNLFASLACFGLGCRPEDNGRCQVRFSNCPSAVSDSAPCLSFGKRRLSLGEAECGSGRETAPEACCVEEEGNSQFLSICNCPAPRG